MAVDIQKLFNEDLPARFAEHPDEVKQIGRKFQYNIIGDGGGEWLVDASDSGPRVVHRQEVDDPADVTVTISAADFQRLLENPQVGLMLYFGGRLQIQGDPSLLTRAVGILMARA